MTRLLIVDDSALMRRLLVEIFSSDPDFTTETARNGNEALEKLHAFTPDVMTLDIHMPGMDGLACLDRIMVERPTPVVMLSALTEEGAHETFEALALGAVDFIPKPAGAVSLEIGAISAALIAKVRAASMVRLSKLTRLSERLRLKSTARRKRTPHPLGQTPVPGAIRPRTGEGLVLVGTSTGGPPALDKLLMPLPASFPWPIVIAQHMPSTFTGALARRLDKICALRIEEVSRPVPLEKGHAYVGRGDADVIVARRPAGLFAMAAPASSSHRWHPSVDRLVDSALEHVAAQQLIGVLMTGMGDDGADAMTRLHNAGGLTIAEAEDSAVVWGMPGALVQKGGASIVADVTGIAGHLLDLVASQ